jgi:hypothetical protein
VCSNRYRLWTLKRVAALLALGAMGCSGAVAKSGAQDGDGGTTRDAGSSSRDGGGASWSPVCPVDPPAVGSACSSDAGIQCEYGTLQYNIQCDTVLQCSGGTWSSFTEDDTAGLTCVKDGPNPAACPATLAEVSQDSTCAQSLNNVVQCAYPEGVCACEWAGSPNGYIWICDPPPGCPFPRPRLGTACTGDTGCEYERCGYDQSCQGGVWTGQFGGCG